jgi:hypothetical protein
MHAANLIERTYTPTLIPLTALWSGRRFAEPNVMDPIQPYLVAEPAANATAPPEQIEKAAVPSVVYGHDDRDRVKARFRLLRRLPADHDNEGAAAAQPESVDAAIAFIDQMCDYPAPCYATLDDDGSAVIEFEDRGTGFFADMTFRGTGDVVCYVRRPNRPSRLLEGRLNSRAVRDFLASEMDVIF